ncbi:hypothetical protein AAMO2058_000828100 [Amorphochlora amoebiformis]
MPFENLMINSQVDMTKYGSNIRNLVEFSGGIATEEMALEALLVMGNDDLGKALRYCTDMEENLKQNYRNSAVYEAKKKHSGCSPTPLVPVVVLPPQPEPPAPPEPPNPVEVVVEVEVHENPPGPPPYQVEVVKVVDDVHQPKVHEIVIPAGIEVQADEKLAGQEVKLMEGFRSAVYSWVSPSATPFIAKLNASLNPLNVAEAKKVSKR